jgi:hypothetical protein
MIRRVLDAFDRWVTSHEDYRPIGEGGYVLRTHIARYRRERLRLADGTVLEAGDQILELHLDNQFASTLHQGGQGGFRFRDELRRMMPALARDVSSRPEYRDVRAVGAATLITTPRLVRGLGFEIRPLPPYTRWWLGTWERILLAGYHPEGLRRLTRGRRPELQHVWIGRRALLRHLGDDGAAHGGDVCVSVRPDTA